MAAVFRGNIPDHPGYLADYGSNSGRPEIYKTEGVYSLNERIRSREGVITQ